MKDNISMTTNIHEQRSAIVAMKKHLKTVLENDNTYDEIVIVCIGTDKCIGDCLGPLIGTILKKKEFYSPVYGTLKRPIHALNLKERLKSIKIKHPHALIIAVDACLGETDNIGTIQIRSGPIDPGKGVGKDLPSVGDLSIIGIVDMLSNNTSMSLHNIRLSFVFDMAEIIAEGIVAGIQS